MSNLFALHRFDNAWNDVTTIGPDLESYVRGLEDGGHAARVYGPFSPDLLEITISMGFDGALNEEWETYREGFLRGLVFGLQDVRDARLAQWS